MGRDMLTLILCALVFCAGIGAGLLFRLPKWLQRPPPVLPNQKWLVPGIGVLTVGGIRRDGVGVPFVMQPNVEWQYWPKLEDWYRSGAVLVDDETADMLKVIAEMKKSGITSLDESRKRLRDRNLPANVN